MNHHLFGLESVTLRVTMLTAAEVYNKGLFCSRSAKLNNGCQTYKTSLKVFSSVNVGKCSACNGLVLVIENYYIVMQKNQKPYMRRAS